MGADPAGPHVVEEPGGRRGGRSLRVRPPDVDPGVVVGPADPRAAVGVDVDRRRQVELRGARPVADLPDREELGQAPAVARGERGLDGVEGMGQRTGDSPLVEIGGDRFDVVVVGLEPGVVLGRDPEQSTWTAWGSPLKPTVSSSETKQSSGWAATSSSAPSMVSWSVSVTKSIPRRLASA
jgi:hypothetical protein